LTVRYLADEDLRGDIVRGLVAREPGIDLLDAKQPGLRGKPDPDLLDLAAQEGRIVITHDRRTMIRFFQQRAASGVRSPGVFVIYQRVRAGDAIEALLLVWRASSAEEWEDRIYYLPF
jgi:hypothetical protein